MLLHGRVTRIFGLVLLMLLTLLAATALVFAAISVAVDWGYLRSQQFDLTAPAVVGAILGITGLIGAIIAFDRNLLESKALRARFAFDINQAFFQSDRERELFYKLEHEVFQFDKLTFPRSAEEQDLDRILYRLSLVGKLLRDGTLTIGDIQFMKYIAKSVLTNREVLNYLSWLKIEAPDHASFVDAVYLFRQAYGRNSPAFKELKKYIG